LDPERLRRLVAAWNLHDPAERDAAVAAALTALGAPDDDAIVTAAVVGLDSEDRNVRNAMVKVLARYATPAATEGILRGLADPTRRVRMSSARACNRNHLGDPRVVDALRAIVEDEGEIRRIRFVAFFVLTSAGAREVAPDLAVGALGALVESGAYRQAILVRLCQSLDQTDETRALLQQFVDTGDKLEAVMATRALCGYVLTRPELSPPSPFRQGIKAIGERAEDVDRADLGIGVGNYWVPRARLVEVLTELA
jgi:hypothetical protein